MLDLCWKQGVFVIAELCLNRALCTQTCCASHPTPPMNRLGMPRQDSCPTGRRDIPHREVSCSAVKLGEIGRQGRTSQSDGACLLKSLVCVWEPRVPGDI